MASSPARLDISRRRMLTTGHYYVLLRVWHEAPCHADASCKHPRREYSFSQQEARQWRRNLMKWGAFFHIIGSDADEKILINR